MSSAASARFPVTKYSALNSPRCSSAKDAAKSEGACSAAGSLILDATEPASAQAASQDAGPAPVGTQASRLVGALS